MKNKMTIGLLIEGISGPYQAGIWPGIADTARSLGVGCICYCGGSLDKSPQNKWEIQRNALFDLALKDNLDGYIISGSLGDYIPRERFLEFIDRFREKPVVSLIPITDSIPSVYVDNRKGMHDLVMHLIRDHQYTSFAFFQGPEGNVEAQERFRLFEGLLRQHNLSLNPEAVIKGDFNRESGRRAADYLLNRKMKIDVIVAADDEIALGALQALLEKGVCIPKDMALVGFDDIAESAVTTPPLTTVTQPMYQLGKKVMEMLIVFVQGGKKPPMAILDATLQIRQSCRCFNPSLKAEKIWMSPAVKIHEGVSDTKQDAAEEVMERLDPAIRGLARTVVEAFFHDVALGGSALFLNEVNTIGVEATQAQKTEVWNTIFLELWKYSVEHFNQTQFLFADRLLHGSSTISVDLEKRFWIFKQIKIKEKNELLRMLGQRIANTLDIELLLDTVTLRFPQMGIKTFFIFFHDHPEQKKSKPELIVACVQGQRISFSVGDDFTLPKLSMSMSDQAKEPIFLVESLYFQNERYGFIVFEVDTPLYEVTLILPEYVSSALHSIFLINEVRRQTAVLSEANAELEKLRTKEHALLEKINKELEQGRNIQRGFLPQTFPKLPDWEVAASFVPARAVSGDFYDTFMLGERYLALVIADVCGKDVSAALFMALICTLIRVHSEWIHAQGGNPLDAIALINNYIMRHYAQTKERQMYTTIFFGLLDIRQAVLRYCNAGHYAPLLISEDETFKRLDTTGPAVGLIKGATFLKESVSISPDSLLCAFTDGVIDARNSDHDQFTFERFFNILKQKTDSASDKLKQIEIALSNHIQGAEPSDDITILLLRRGKKAF